MLVARRLYARRNQVGGRPIAALAKNFPAIDLEAEARAIRQARTIHCDGAQSDVLRLAVGFFSAAEHARRQPIERLLPHSVGPPQLRRRNGNAARDSGAADHRINVEPLRDGRAARGIHPQFKDTGKLAPRVEVLKDHLPFQGDFVVADGSIQAQLIYDDFCAAFQGSPRARGRCSARDRTSPSHN